MNRFSAHELQRNPGPIREAAIKSPVAITYHGRDRLIIMSVDQYQRLKRRDRQVFRIEDLPRDYIEILREPYSAPEQDALNHLLDDLHGAS